MLCKTHATTLTRSPSALRANTHTHTPYIYATTTAPYIDIGVILFPKHFGTTHTFPRIVTPTNTHTQFTLTSLPSLRDCSTAVEEEALDDDACYLYNEG